MFNWVDLIIIAIILFYLVDGIRRGFIEQGLELIGFLIAILLALWTYRSIQGVVASHLGVSQQTSGPISFLIVWVVLQALYSLFLRFLYPLIPFKFRHARANKIAGVITALIRSVIIIAVILTFIAITPVPTVGASGSAPLQTIRQAVDGSFFGSRLIARSGEIESLFNKLFGYDLKQSLTFLTVPAQNEQIIAPNESVDLKFKTTDVTVDYASEQKMLGLVNQERAKVGLAPVAWNEQLAQVARAHSADMFARGYFAHEDPDGKSPFDRMQAAGIHFKAAGENLAYAATVDLAHNGLMRSPGHRANILDKDFGQLGIGVIDAGVYGKMFTQDFTD